MRRRFEAACEPIGRRPLLTMHPSVSVRSRRLSERFAAGDRDTGSGPEAMGDEAILQLGRDAFFQEAAALQELGQGLDESFVAAVRKLFACPGRVLTTGLGKSGIVARKLAATFTSTGTPSHFIHPVEAAHGDLGVVRGSDILIALSRGGDNAEVVALLANCAQFGMTTIAITGNRQSDLVALAAFLANVGTYLCPTREAVLVSCLLDLALLVFVTAIILSHVVEEGKVDADRIFGAVCGYLLIGLTWALIYGALDLVQPGSFDQGEAGAPADAPEPRSSAGPRPRASWGRARAGSPSRTIARRRRTRAPERADPVPPAPRGGGAPRPASSTPRRPDAAGRRRARDRPGCRDARCVATPLHAARRRGSVHRGGLEPLRHFPERTSHQRVYGIAGGRRSARRIAGLRDAVDNDGRVSWRVSGGTWKCSACPSWTACPVASAP